MISNFVHLADDKIWRLTVMLSATKGYVKYDMRLILQILRPKFMQIVLVYNLCMKSVNQVNKLVYKLRTKPTEVWTANKLTV